MNWTKAADIVQALSLLMVAFLMAGYLFFDIAYSSGLSFGMFLCLVFVGMIGLVLEDKCSRESKVQELADVLWRLSIVFTIVCIVANSSSQELTHFLIAKPFLGYFPFGCAVFSLGLRAFALYRIMKNKKRMTDGSV